MTPEARIQDLERRINNLLRIGTIETADYAVARVRVRIGALLTAPLPWITTRAGHDRSWWAPEIGEQVVILSPGGDLVQGVVLPSVYSDSKPQPENRESVYRILFSDGASLAYDREAHHLKASVPGDIAVQAEGRVDVLASGDVTIKGSSITLDGPVSATSTIQAQANISTSADVLAGAISLKNHKHGGISTGQGITGAPQ